MTRLLTSAALATAAFAVPLAAPASAQYDVCEVVRCDAVTAATCLPGCLPVYQRCYYVDPNWFQFCVWPD